MVNAGEKIKSDLGTTRISSLDGLRGLAVVLVMINHLSLDPINAMFTRISQSLPPIYAGNGKTGVSLLLMLSGYLISTYYPVVPKVASFWQKRYTRVFPPLISMCFSLGLIFILGQHFPPVARLLVVVAVASIGGWGWRALQRSKDRRNIGKRIFFAFLSLQVATAVYYLFILTRTPPQVFYILWPVWIQEAIATVVNATMTLPFGVYIGQLDGVYWSLTIEIMFYLLYPILVLPLLGVVQSQRSVVVRGLAVALLFPFIYGLYLLFPHVLGFGVMNIQYFIYFIAGIAVAQLQKSNYKFWTGWQKLGTRLGSASIVIALIALLAPAGVYPYLPPIIHPIINILLAIPMTFVFGWTLAATAWAKLMQSRRLVYLGSISYSLYLTHSLTIGMWNEYIKPDTVFRSALVGIFAITTALILAKILNVLLEKPYFNKEPRIISAVKNLFETKPTPKGLLHTKKFMATAGVVVMVMLLVIGTWIAFRPPIGVMNTVSNYSTTALSTETNITETPKLVPFQADDANLAMVYMHVKRHSTGKEVTAPQDDKPSMLVAKVLDDQGKELSSARYKINDIGDAPNQPVGLPIQPNSAGRTYTLSLSIEHPQPDQGISLLNGRTLLRPVYIANKQTLLHQPVALLKTFISAALFPLEQTEAVRVLALALPLLAGLLVLSLFTRSKSLA